MPRAELEPPPDGDLEEDLGDEVRAEGRPAVTQHDGADPRAEAPAAVGPDDGADPRAEAPRGVRPEDGGGSPEPGRPWLGRVLADKYRIVRFVAAGGTAEVYEAERIGSAKRVALKLLHTALAASDEAMARFEQEARLVSLIAHPNVVAIQDFGTLPEGIHFMVMELLEGRSFGELLADGPVDALPALRWVMHACEGLAAAHERGVVHCDIKPDNLFLQQGPAEAEPIVKILDLGIGRLVTRVVRDESADTEGIAGTPDYMSPEQCQGQPLGPASDIYSLGVVLHEMLLGCVPFSSASYREVIDMHIHATPEWPRTLAEALGVPDAVERVVLRALSKDPAARPASMVDFQQELGILARDLRAADAPASRWSRAPRDSAPPRNTKPPRGSSPPRNSRRPRSSTPPRNTRPRITMAPQAAGSAQRLAREGAAERELALELARLRTRVPELERAVSSLERALSRDATRYDVCRALLEAPSFAAAALRMLEVVCTGTASDTGGLWLPDDEPVLRCAEVWARPSIDLAAFLDATKQASFARGRGLPGRVWAGERTEHILDLARDPDFARLHEARAVGLRTAFAFAIRADSQVVAVMDFYSRETRTPDAECLAMLDELGALAGHRLARQRLRDELEAARAAPGAGRRDPGESGSEAAARDALGAETTPTSSRVKELVEMEAGVLALSLVGELDAYRRSELARRLQAEVRRARAKAVLVDVAGLATADERALDQVLLLTQAVQAFGARCILTGVGPGTAPGFARLGRDLGAVPMLPTLADGLAACRRLTERDDAG